MLAVFTNLTQTNLSLYTESAFKKRLQCLEFAATVACTLKFGRCYLPDYLLFYLDNETNFKLIYCDEEDDYDQTQETMSRQTSSKAPNLSLSQKNLPRGRNIQGIVDFRDFDEEDYYEE